MSRFWEGTIIGNLPSLKNRRVMYKNRRTGKMFPAKSPSMTDYKESAQKQMLAVGVPQAMLQGPLHLHAEVWYSSRRPDLDVAFLMDILEGFVYKNDRQIAEIHAEKKLDKANPRVYIRVSEMEPHREEE